MDQCPNGSNPIFESTALDECNANGEITAADGSVTGACRGESSCRVVCQFVNPCACGVASITRDEISCQECAQTDCRSDLTQCAAGFSCLPLDDGTWDCLKPEGGACGFDNECVTGYCDNGFCCAGGDCCAQASDCPAEFSQAPTCDLATCGGASAMAVCDNNQCGSAVTEDNSICDGVVADACGDFADVVCDGVTAERGVCADSCAARSDCDPGFTCLDGACVEGDPDGAACETEDSCASGYCQGGLCCSGGECCNEVSDCQETVGAAPSCDDPSSCSGSRTDVLCEAFTCQTEVVEDDSACDSATPVASCQGNLAFLTCSGEEAQEGLGCQSSCQVDGEDDDALCAPGTRCVDGGCTPCTPCTGPLTVTDAEGLGELAGCSAVSGDLTISSNAPTDTLEGLSCLTTVAGDLRVQNNVLLSEARLRSLQQVDGAVIFNGNPNLTAIEAPALTAGDVDIQNNPLLETIVLPRFSTGDVELRGNAALTSATTSATVEGAVTVVDNDSLTRIRDLRVIMGGLTLTGNDAFTSATGLNDLVEVEGDVALTGNTSLAPLATLTLVGGDVTITDNPDLPDLAGLDTLTEVGGDLTIAQNAVLAEVDGLASLATVAGALTISNNPALTTWSGANALSVLGGSLQITQNETLTEVGGLGSLTEAGVISITNNPALERLVGLTSLTTAGELTVQDSPTLSSLAGLDALTEAGALTLVSLGGLGEMDGLTQLTTVTGALVVTDNPTLTSVGMGALETAGELTIARNPALASLNTLSALAIVGGALTLDDNDALTSLDGVSPSSAGSVTITNHALLCQREADLFAAPLAETTTVTANIGSCADLCAPCADLGPMSLSDDASFAALSSCSALPDSLTVSVSPQNYGPLSCLTAIEGPLVFRGADANPSHEGVDFFPALTSVGGLEFFRVWSLTSIEGLSSLTEINGDLIFEDARALTSLAGLESITTLGSLQFISLNTALPSLSPGLDNLEAIDGALALEGNASNDHLAFTDLEGLNALTSVGSLTVRNVRRLTSLDALANLEAITTGDLVVEGNDALTRAALPALAEVGGAVVLRDNPALAELSLPLITEVVGELALVDSALADVDGLSAVTSVGGDLSVTDNAMLTSLGGLQGLTSIGGRFIFTENPMVTDLGDFPLLTDVASFNISTNANLTRLDGFNAWAGGEEADVTIFANPRLVNVSGFQGAVALRTLTYGSNGGDEIMEEGAALTGFTSVEAMTGDLRVTSNPYLLELSGLSSLETVGGLMEIGSNYDLRDISGLDALTSVAGNLTIYLNRLCQRSTFERAETLGSASINVSANVGACTQCEPCNFGEPLNIGFVHELANIAHCSEINVSRGGVFIDGNNFLDPLSCLTSVNSDLRINASYFYRDNAPIDLSPLGALTTVDGEFLLQGSFGVEDLTALSSLQSTQSIRINMPDLTSLNGLRANTNAITITFGGTTLSGYDFSRLSGSGCSVEENGNCSRLGLNGNPALTDLSALSGITTLGYATILGNDALTSLSGLSGLQTVTGRFGGMNISNNPSLTSLSGMSSLYGVRGLTVEGNNALCNDDARAFAETLFAGTDFTLSCNPLSRCSSTISVRNNGGDCF